MVAWMFQSIYIQDLTCKQLCSSNMFIIDIIHTLNCVMAVQVRIYTFPIESHKNMLKCYIAIILGQVDTHCLLYPLANSPTALL